jgi:hypothetical protein
MCECHINVEIPVNTTAIRYLYKYITKGHNRAYLNVKGKDKIDMYIDARYLSAPEGQSSPNLSSISAENWPVIAACWQLLKFPMMDRSPAMTRLTIHKENEQLVYFDSAEKARGQIVSGKASQTTLTGFFELNVNNARGAAGRSAQTLLYDEIPTYFWWDTSAKEWKPRKTIDPAVGRIFSISYLVGENFYLQVLLLNQKGCQSFSELKTVEGKTVDTYREA